MYLLPAGAVSQPRSEDMNPRLQEKGLEHLPKYRMVVIIIVLIALLLLPVARQKVGQNLP